MVFKAQCMRFPPTGKLNNYFRSFTLSLLWGDILLYQHFDTCWNCYIWCSKK